MKKAEHKRETLLANLGDLNRPLRVRPVRYMGREWWAIAADDTWPGMVMDLRRLGFEAMAIEEEVLVRESVPAYETQMEGPTGPEGLKPFPVIHPTIHIQKESYMARYTGRTYLEEEEEEDTYEPENLDYDVEDADEEE
ncbi:hypothetical protein EPA93_21985 [Ktedonosporobacter rubrisoli]|uniref:Uncharacterized protein n=1 Tax=Ktedonosporobacter rubrisoli TaxID=2509675 RepID=A0A4P6JSK4_KTERU|nr:hypothetical protein [Ktedonosporobacter rubrisoli]QBD78517.1 hypothetical protein EPA93_21985 [Ktedonosporobacter rubrisoli]